LPPRCAPTDAAPASDGELRDRLEAAMANDAAVADAWRRSNPRPDRKDLSASGWAQALLNLLAIRHHWTEPELRWAFRRFYAERATEPGDQPWNASKEQHTVETALRARASPSTPCGASRARAWRP
jgi:hypothetical protein